MHYLGTVYKLFEISIAKSHIQILEQKYITFSQCLHCSSKLRLEAAALAFFLAFFPTMTQLFIKLLGKKYIFSS